MTQVKTMYSAPAAKDLSPKLSCCAYPLGQCMLAFPG
jgi:hypothetical protein